MVDKLAELPRVRLAAHKLRRLEIRAQYEWSLEVVNKLRELPDMELPGSAVFAGQAVYTTAKVTYSIRASVRASESLGRVDVSIEYFRWTGKRRRRTEEDREREAGLVNALSDLGIPRDCLYTFIFKFDSDAVESLWFPLPTQVGGEGERVFEIEGIAAAKLAVDEDSEPDYRFFMSTSGAFVNLNVFVSRNSEVTPNAILDALAIAKRNASELITTKERG